MQSQRGFLEIILQTRCEFTTLNGAASMETITFIGDLFMPFPATVLGPLPDGIIVNLEAPISCLSSGWPGKVNLQTVINPIEEVFCHRAAAVCLANNHIMDYGPEGLKDTLTALNLIGVPYFGAGTEQDNCRNPLLLRVNGCTIALAGYVCESTHPVFCMGSQPGVMPLSVGKILDDIAEARRMGARIVVVSLHWGMEEVPLPTPHDILKAHAIVEGGADMIIGHHAHCIQPFEVYLDRYIFYGLGNAFFPNLDVPCYCNAEGRPESRYIKKQRPWNRHSLAVTLRPRDMQTWVTPLGRKADTMCWGQPERALSSCRLSFNGGYPARFRRARLWSLLRMGLYNWVEHPRLPRLHHIVSLLSMLPTLPSKKARSRMIF